MLTLQHLLGDSDYMRITVLEKRSYIVPPILESEMQSAIQLEDKEYLDELLGDIETHGGLDGIETIKVEEIK